MTKTFKELRDFNWQIPQIVASLPQGKDSKALYELLQADVKHNYNSNPNMTILSHNEETKEIIGSNIFVASRANELLRNSGIRVVVPADDQQGDISRLIRGRFFTDFNASVLRTAGDSYKPNDKIAKNLAEKIEQKQGRLKLPVMILSPLVRNSEDKSYGLEFDLDEYSQVIEDERLNGKKYSTGMKFKTVDDIGLPLFDKKGDRTWYAREDGLSRFVLDGDLDLYSGCEYLADSGELGRVVLVSGEATREKI